MQSLRDKISIKSSSGKLKLPSKVRERLSKICMKFRQQLWRDIGKRKILILLFMRSIRNSNLNGFSYNKQIDGDQGAKR